MREKWGVLVATMSQRGHPIFVPPQYFSHCDKHNAIRKSGRIAASADRAASRHAVSAADAAFAALRAREAAVMAICGAVWYRLLSSERLDAALARDLAALFVSGAETA